MFLISKNCKYNIEYSHLINQTTASSWNLLFLVFFAISTIVLSIWLLRTCREVSSFITIEEASSTTYDYIIVGAGTAGSVLANRLTANSNITVLLVEAGGFFGLLRKVPLLATFQQRTNVDWQYETTEQKHSSSGFVGKKQFLPRGKGLGGSSQLNYMLHFSGLESDFRRWRSHGLHFSNGNPLIHEVDGEQTSYCKPDLNSCATGQDASTLSINQIPYDYSKLSMAFVDAVNELKVDDRHLKLHLAQYNTLRGLRHSVFDAYLKPAFSRKNLKILINSRVHRVNFNDRQIESISVSPENNLSLNKIRRIHVRGEVILCAGSLNTPLILMHSGIGPTKELKAMGIPVKQHSPNIGQNLYDHLNVPLFVALNETTSITKDKILSFKEIWSYLAHREGLFSNFGVLGYVHSMVGNHSVGLFGVGAIDEDALRGVANYDQETFRASFPYYSNGSQEGLVLLNSCDQPSSRGYLTLKSRHVRNLLQINPNYLESSDDIACTIRAIRLAVQLISTRHFQQMNATIIWPAFRNCKNLGPFPDDFKTNHPSDRYLECVIRTSGTTAHHPGGSCSIGNSAQSPLDALFRVRGVEGLRVVDASVLPTPVSGTPHTILVEMAEHASRAIIKDH